MVTVCFTGHRPNKLGGYNWNSIKNIEIMKALNNQILEIVNANDEIKFICGGALGIDQMSFYICELIRRKNKGITIELAIPFKYQPNAWNKENVEFYEIQQLQANKITYVDKLENYKIIGYKENIYLPAKMQKRNEYMVDRSNIVIAVWDGSKGGTANCVKYAEKLGKRIIIINPKDVFQNISSHGL